MKEYKLSKINIVENFLVSYSSKGYYKRHKELNKSAKKFGLKKIFEYHDYQLKRTKYYGEHHNIFNHLKGGGYWLWKPYYILQALTKIKDGDNLFYVDAASRFINSPKVLFDICNCNPFGLVAFDKRPLLNRQYCKRETFINMNCDSEKYWDEPQTIATMLLLKKSDFTVNFVKEWLQYCEDPRNIINDNDFKDHSNKYKELNGFIDHRSDQSILSILIKKYNIETYRNPTKWGNFLKLKDFREPGEYSGAPYDIFDKTINVYSETPMLNSPFETIFEINRGKDEPSSFQKLEWKLRNRLSRLKSILMKQ